MNFKPVAYLLVLLLVPAWLDDAYCAATPDPDDDLYAAETYQFLPALGQSIAKRSHAAGCRASGRAGVQPPCWCRTIGPCGRTPATVNPAATRPPLLYVLVSLQR
jgi:hypothetical protein